MSTHFKTKKYHFYYTTLKKTISGAKQKTRTTGAVMDEYGQTWPDIKGWLQKQADPHVYLLNGKQIVSSNLEYRKRELKLISKHIGKPESILELGSGNGFILLSLAALHPEINVVRGLELTRGGIATAKQLRNNPPTKEIGYMTDLRPEEVAARLKGRDIDFFQGDMTKNIPVKDNSFECVFSSQAIEQIPVNYMAAFKEAYRITRKRAVFAEEFRDVQNIFQILHLRWRDFFRAPSSVVADAGFTVTCVEPLEFTKIMYGVAAVVGEK